MLEGLDKWLGKSMDQKSGDKNADPETDEVEEHPVCPEISNPFILLHRIWGDAQAYA